MIPLSTISMSCPMIAYQGMLPFKHLVFLKTLLRKPIFFEYCSKVLTDILTSFPVLNSFKIFCLGSFLLAEIILATIRCVTLLSSLLDTVLLHIDKFLVIPDTLTPFWNILHIAALTPSGM